jgi:hypothetical protein
VKKVYTWKVGSRFDADPQTVGEAIAVLGSPTAKEIVSAAKPKRSPLHDLFEWDDAEAANEYRLDTAQKIARCLLVEVHMVELPDGCTCVRAFESVRTGDAETRQYVPIIEALSNEDYRRQIVGRMVGELEGLRKQLAAYSHFGAPIVKAGKHVGRAIETLAAA